MWGNQGRSQGFKIDGAEKLGAQGIFRLKRYAVFCREPQIHVIEKVVW
jgi:hypothetical protein